MRGEATLEECNDKNLGKTNKYGFRNITKIGDESRLFGAPTIRTDIKQPAMKSVADPNVIYYNQ